MLDQEVEVLVDSHNFKDSALLKGRTRCWKKVIFRGADNLIGTLQNVRITGFTHETLHGELISAHHHG
jgi:tRNA-2-methylthio-N6-dimethylallyladenosine synthase